MHYAFQVSLVFSLAGKVIEFLLGRKMSIFKCVAKSPSKTDTSLAKAEERRFLSLFCLSLAVFQSDYF